MSTENELRIKDKIVELNSEISNIINIANGDIGNADLSKFFRIVTELEHIKNTTPSTGITQGISTLIEQCCLKPETIENYQALLPITQGFMDSIHL